MKNKFKITTLKVEDIPLIENLVRNMWIYHDHMEPDLVSPQSTWTTSFQKYYEDSINDFNQKVYIIKMDSRIIATLRTEIKDTPHFYKEKKMVYLDDLVIDKDYRRQGFATILIKHAIHDFERRGINLFEAKIYEFNKASQKTLEKNGFRKVFSYFYNFTK